MIDGHGGRAAADYVAENLGKNIVKALENIEDSKHVEKAIQGGYIVTDKEFISKVGNHPLQINNIPLNVSTTLLRKTYVVLT